MENSEPYKVATIKLKQINRVKTDHEFRKIIKLSRFVNHVRFCQRTMVANRDDFYRDLATAKRDVNAAIVLGAGSFFELLKTLKSMESNFKQFENPKKKIRDLLNKPLYAAHQGRQRDNSVRDRTIHGCQLHIDAAQELRTA